MAIFKGVQNFREIQLNDRVYSKVKTTAGINCNAKTTDLTGDDRATAVAFSQIANILPNIVQGQSDAEDTTSLNNAVRSDISIYNDVSPLVTFSNN